MKVFIKEEEGFDIYFEAVEEHLSLRELLPEHNDEQLEEIYENSEIFCAKVTAEKLGIELGCDYLGGCIYESQEDFYIKYKDCYFSDMVQNAIEEAKEQIKELSK